MKLPFVAGLTSLSLSVSLAGYAGPKTHAKVKNPAAPVMYKARCVMTYTAAQAKKYGYVCPMDKQPLVEIVPKANPGKAA